MELEVAYTAEQLHTNPALACTLASMLRSKSLESLLQGQRSATLVRARLGSRCKRWKHLRVSLQKELLSSLEPGIFTEDFFESCGADAFLPFITVGLNVAEDGFLPTNTFPQMEYVMEFKETSVARCKLLGERLNGGQA